jgi:GTP cyclohydrolase IA
MDKNKIINAFKDVLEAIGEDPKRSGIERTPERMADLFEDIFEGINKDPGVELESFISEKHDEMVLIKDISLYSMCEHHFLPFIGKAHVAYIPKNNVVTGFSKIANVVELLSKRLQLQERLTTQIADVIMDKLDPMGVIVVIEAEHLCMSMRGIKKTGSSVITSAVRGIFRKNEATRAEAMSLIKN